MPPYLRRRRASSVSPRGFGNIDISAKVKKNEETVRIRPPGPFLKNLILQMYIRTYKIDIINYRFFNIIDMYVNNQHLPLTFVRKNSYCLPTSHTPCHVMWSFFLKSVHFKKTVAQSSFLSKVLSFLAEIKTNSAKMTLLKEMRIVQLSS